MSLRRLLKNRRRTGAARDQSETGHGEMMPRLESLERRIQHLESMLEGLQDSVHRESVRQGNKLDQLERNLEPSAIRRALGRDAREHGL
jgi:hypothetical protein